MSATQPIEPASADPKLQAVPADAEPDTAPAGVAADAGSSSWRVRGAVAADVAAIATAVAQLLLELGGTPPEPEAMRATTLALLGDRDAGAVLVADADGALVGVLAASWQTAIHTAGRYGLIQDLWVHPSWRSKAIGAALVQAMVELARRQRVGRVEVGLPREGFDGLEATEAFYARNGFTALGRRMRLVLP
jgi:GNAT superfamily N-acetyltransferase